MTFPTTWTTRRARFLFDRRDVRGAEAPLASATKDGVILRSDLDYSVWNPDSNVSNYKLVEPNDFVIGLRSFQHGISHSTVRGIVSPAYTVLRQAGPLDPQFIKHYFRSSLLVSHLANITQGIRQGQAIDIEAFQNLNMPVPPREEQRRIADFLDAETARIEHLGRLDDKLLRLLAERRQAVIDNVVDSSSTSSIKLFWGLSLLRDGTHQPPQRVDSGVPLLTARNVSGGSVRLTDMDTQVSEKDATLLEKSLLLTPGDLLLSVKGTIGACAVTPPGFPRAVLDRNVALLRPSCKYSSEWLAFALRSTSLQQQMRLSVTAVAQPGLPLGAIRELRVPDATSIAQADGVSRISAACQEIDRIVDYVKRKDLVLRERRQALITAAVTGQFDVSTASGRNVTDGVPTA